METPVIDHGHENLLTDLEVILSLVKKGEFHDFKTNLATPKVDLRNAFLVLAQSCIDGRYDNIS